jgi:outer membrane protein assembly factor BamB
VVILPFREVEIIHKFEPQTGLKLENQVRPVTEDGPWFHRPLGEGIDLRMDKKALWAVERKTGKELWHIARFGFGEVATPAIIGDFLAITCDSELRVLKLSSGEVVWGISGIVSNPVVLGDKVYVIANDASIRVHDLKTGRKLGVLKLEPAVTDDSRYSYALVASEASQMVYAYYGDSQEIIAFGN